MPIKDLNIQNCIYLESPLFIINHCHIVLSHLNCGDLNTINYIFESLIFNLLVIIHRLISERQLFTFEIASNGCLHYMCYLKFDDSEFSSSEQAYYEPSLISLLAGRKLNIDVGSCYGFIWFLNGPFIFEG